MSTCSEFFANPARMVAKTFEYPRVPGGDPAKPSQPAAQPSEVVSRPMMSTATPVEPEVTKADVAAAYEKGRRDGQREAEAQYAERIVEVKAFERARMAQVIADFKQSNAEYFNKVELQLVSLSMAIAGKILHREAQVDPLLLAALVRVATDNLKQGSSVQVNIRPEDVPAWRKYFDDPGNSHVTVELVADATLGPGDCVVHSEVGTAALGIDAQMKEIERGLFDLLSQRPQ